ncbi:hypothetical protein [Paenibacillus sp. 453mf]|uniref:hypothetical protein n=1 Tax=Paenibacillus sp. 453mf TaxID=1761874 RepID=UPI0008F319B4|nr:hypothetical protein SAMN04488601_10340 [Paenibacillus sp. 453mf]
MKRVLTLILVSMICLLCVGQHTYAASIGGKLTSPEEGWKRYDDKDSKISYTNGWYDNKATSYSNGSIKLTSSVGEKVSFKFYGTKLRLISDGNTDRTENFEIQIDGASEGFSLKRSAGYQYLVYENLDLGNGLHTVELTTTDTKIASLDAVEIDESGWLVVDEISEKVNLSSYNGIIFISWDDMGLANNFTLKRSDTPGGPYSTIASDLNSKSYVDRNLINGKSYYYVLEARVNSELIHTTHEFSATPEIPVIEGMEGAAPPENTTALASSVYSDQLGQLAIDNDLETKWNARVANASLQLDFPYPIDINFVQFAAQTTPETQVDYQIFGLYNGEWLEISPVTTRTVNLDTEMKVLEPIPVQQGKYESIKININAKSSWASLHEITLGVTDDTSTNPEEPGGETPNPEKPGSEIPSGDRAILLITYTTGLIKEYDLSNDEVDRFISWYDTRDSGTGPSKYAIDKHDNNIGPFKKRTDYVIFNNILTFEVSEY